MNATKKQIYCPQLWIYTNTYIIIYGTYQLLFAGLSMVLEWPSSVTSSFQTPTFLALLLSCALWLSLPPQHICQPLLLLVLLQLCFIHCPFNPPVPFPQPTPFATLCSFDLYGETITWISTEEATRSYGGHFISPSIPYTFSSFSYLDSPLIFSPFPVSFSPSHSPTNLS